jgi:hypothetical protein
VSRELHCRASTGYTVVDFDDALAVAGTVDLRPAIGGVRELDAAATAVAELRRPGPPAKLLLSPDSTLVTPDGG